jgi:hypothetical protein
MTEVMSSIPASTKSGLVDQPPPAERREATRFPMSIEFFYRPITSPEDDLWWLAQVRNISMRGLGLVLQRTLAPGTLLEVELENPAKDFHRVVQARVVHVQPASGHGFMAGCAFVNKLNPDEVQAIL